jgi:hypothetical protein
VRRRVAVSHLDTTEKEWLNGMTSWGARSSACRKPTAAVSFDASSCAVTPPRASVTDCAWASGVDASCADSDEGSGFVFPAAWVLRGWRAAERRRRTGRARMGSPTLHTLQDPILLTALALLSKWRLSPKPRTTLKFSSHTSASPAGAVRE